MLRTLMVPLDGTRHAEHALPWAIEIANRSGGDIEVVHVLEEATYPDMENLLMDEPEEAARHRAMDYIEEIRRKIEPHFKGTLTATLLEGSVTTSILSRARQVAADLVIMTTHGRGAMSRFWEHSTADDLVRTANMGILLVHSTRYRLDLSNRPTIARTLVPLDGSQIAERIVEPAIELGTLLETEFHLLRIVEPVMSDHVDPWFSVPARIDVGLRTEAQNYLDRAASKFRGQSLRVTTQVEESFDPAGVIIKEASRRSSSLVALETEDRSHLSRMLLGSVVDKVIRGVSSPILLHRANTDDHPGGD
ncbi:MAG: universal stress protein [Phycisphaeraceae bacterium]|nr:universal stress protein [Phycisphaeraceae bacterium]